KVEACAAHDGDRAETRIVGALANDVRNAFVAPEQSDLMDEVREQLMEVNIGPRARRTRTRTVTQNTAVSGNSIAGGVAKHFAAIELIQRKCAGAGRQPNGTSAEELLQLLHHAEDTDLLVLIQVVEVAHCDDALGRERLIVGLDPLRDAGRAQFG